MSQCNFSPSFSPLYPNNFFLSHPFIYHCPPKRVCKKRILSPLMLKMKQRPLEGHVMVTQYMGECITHCPTSSSFQECFQLDTLWGPLFARRQCLYASKSWPLSIFTDHSTLTLLDAFCFLFNLNSMSGEGIAM